MFSSLKTKISFFVAIVLLVTAAALVYFTYRDVGYAMFRSEEAAARNVLGLLELNIKGEYRKLLSDKIETMTLRRQRLKYEAYVAASVLKACHTVAIDRRISDREAQERALNWIRSFPLEDMNLFVFNNNGQILAHQNPAIDGTFITFMRDIKDRNIAEVMNSSVLKTEGDYAVFSWKNPGEESTNSSGSKKLAFFLPYPQWHMTLCSVIDISDMEAEASRELEKILSMLRLTFADIKIAKSGSVFLFVVNKNMLIPPADFSIQDYRSITNAQTGNPLLDDLMIAAKSERKSIRFLSHLSEDRRIMQAYTRYFGTLDWFIVAMAPVQEIKAPADSLVSRQSMIIAMIFIASLTVTFLLVARISRPLNRLAAYAKELPSHDFTVAEDKAESSIDDLPSKSKDEVGRLAEAFIFMKAELKKNIRHLMETTAVKERIESELNLAREIQLGILPKIFPPFPEHSEFDLHATLRPAKEVGGDLYDFFFIDDDHLCFSVGDVSDKGVAAALFMVITRTLIKTRAQEGLAVDDIMFHINNTLSADNPKTMFVTLIVGILDIHTGEVRYANGGHNPPIIISGDQGSYYAESLSGPFLGVKADIPYQEIVLSLKPGDAILLYTDGVTEAMNPKKEVFSEERLLFEAECLRDRSAVDIINNLLVRIAQHAESEPQSDDIALMVLRYHRVIDEGSSGPI